MRVPGSSRIVLIPGLTDRAHGQYNAGLTQLSGEVGYGMAIQKLAVAPFAGLAWAHRCRPWGDWGDDTAGKQKMQKKQKIVRV